MTAARILVHDNTRGSRFGIRGTDGSPPVRLGERTTPSGFSADEQRVLLTDRRSPCRIGELPIGPGDLRRVDVPGLDCYRAEYAPAGYLLVAHPIGASDRDDRVYLVSADGRRPEAPHSARLGDRDHPQPLAGRALGAGPTLAKTGSELRLYPLAGGESRPVDQLPERTTAWCWGSDSNTLYAHHRGKIPAQVYRVDLTTGAAEPWLTLQPSDPAGVTAIQEVVLTPDGSHYAYSYFQIQTNLYLVTGLR